MRRFPRFLAMTALLFAGGCGAKSYDLRLEHTVDRMKYEKRLNDNLMPAPSKDGLEQFAIFVRPPKSLAFSKVFLLGDLEPGKFDVAESFTEKNKQSLHVLAWVKQKEAPNKKKAAKAAKAAPRDVNRFVDEVVSVLNQSYGVELDKAKLKEDSKKDFSGVENVYKKLAFAGNGKEVQLYLNMVKGAPYQVAMIFEFPKAESAALSQKIELCLGAFATGERAKRKYSNGGVEEEGEQATTAPTAY